MVFTVTVTVAEALGLTATDVGTKVHVAPVGRPEQAKLPTVPLNPLADETVRTIVLEAPGLEMLTSEGHELVFKVKVGFPLLKSVIQLSIKLQAFTDPKPVAKSYPLPALYPLNVATPSLEMFGVQFGLLLMHGIAFVPEVTSLNMQELAGVPDALQAEEDCPAASA